MFQRYIYQIEPYLQYYFMGNTIRLYLWVLAAILVGFIAKYVFVNYLARKILLYLNKKRFIVPPQQINYFIKKPVGFFLNLLIIYNALTYLSFPYTWQLVPPQYWGVRMCLGKSYEILITIAFAWILLQLTNLISSLLNHKANQTTDRSDNQLIYFMKELIKVTIVLFAFFFILSKTFEMNVTSILAGLGIGGLAVALAGKETIENLFASFTIFLDKPFVVGDFIQINQIQGTIEKVGFRSTRIRTIDHSYLTLPNKMLIDNPLDNLTQRKFRRAKFSLQLTLDTPATKIKALVEDIKTLIDTHPRTSKLEQMCVWNTFEDSSYEILIIYYIDTHDFIIFHQIKEQVNYMILDLIEKNEVKLAYHTQTLYINKQPDENQDVLE